MKKIGSRTYSVGDNDFPLQIQVEAKDLEMFIGVVSPALVDQPSDSDFEQPLNFAEVVGNTLARSIGLPGPYPKPSDILITLTVSYATKNGDDPRYEITVQSAKGDTDTSATRAKRPGMTFEYK